MMGRVLRYVPPGGGLVDVTFRTLQGRFLLRPGKRLNAIITGALARAKKRYSVRVHEVSVLSNHCHLLVTVDNTRQLAGFVGYFKSKIARDIGRHFGWREKFWGCRYRAILVSEEEAAQVERLRYHLSQGCKENLVARPQDWPGVHSAKALISGNTLKGIWIDRTIKGELERSGRPDDPTAYVFPSPLILDPLPCWAHLTPEEYRERVAELVFDIEVETAQRHKREGTAPLGQRAILKMNPHTQPDRIKNSPAPRFHAASKAVRWKLKEAYATFVLAYRAAADRLRAGDLTARFPEGCFPPPLPFVATQTDPVPG